MEKNMFVTIRLLPALHAQQACTFGEDGDAVHSEVEALAGRMGQRLAHELQLPEANAAVEAASASFPPNHGGVADDEGVQRLRTIARRIPQLVAAADQDLHAAAQRVSC